jgi:hypothetical protein
MSSRRRTTTGIRERTGPVRDVPGRREDASDKADLIDSEIYQAVLQDEGILALVSAIAPEVENGSSKQFVDEFTGVLISRYVVVTDMRTESHQPGEIARSR